MKNTQINQQGYPHRLSSIKRPIIDAVRQSLLPLKVGSFHSSFRLGTSPVLNQNHRHRKTLKSFFLMGLSCALLSSCGWEWPVWKPLERDPFSLSTYSSGTKKEAPKPPSVIPGDEPDQNDPQSTLLPASTLGLNLDTYFAQDIDDPNLRLMRLENALVAVHRDLQNIPGAQTIPRYQNPIPVEELVEPVVGSGNTTAAPEPASGRTVLASGGPTSLTPNSTKPPSTPVYEASKPAKAKPKTAQATPTGPTRITDLRVGTHKDKVRVVLDVSRKTLYTADLDNGENLLIVELPDAGWSAASTKNFGKNPLLKTYNVDPYNDGKGHIVAIELKGGSSIINQSQIPALSGGGTRIFIDLTR